MQPDEGTNIKERSFSIAFAWAGMFGGGVIWIFWWGARHLPERGTPKEEWNPVAFTTLDLVLMVVIPVACGFALGRYGRKWLP